MFPLPRLRSSVSTCRAHPTRAQLKSYFVALDEGQAMGSAKLSEYDTWYFTSDMTFDKDGVRFTFDQVINGNVYASVIGVDRV